jgi:hypothetical protein
MQRTLFGTNDNPALPHRGYAPVLQDHAGERSALSALRDASPNTLASITPVIEIVGGNKRKLSTDATRGHVKRIALSVGDEWPFYLDFARADPARILQTSQGDVTTAEVAYTAARKRGLPFVPVAWTGGVEAHLNAAANTSIVDGRGLAVRHRLLGTTQPSDTTSDPLKDAVNASQIAPEEIDLLLDLGYLGPDVEVPPRRLNRLVARCVGVADWRRVVLLGGSMPSGLGCVSEGENGFIERREWTLWQSLSDDLQRRVEFGDYGIQNPEPPREGGPGMRANIRYSLEDQHLIVRGRGEVRTEGVGQYIGLCERVLQSGHFAGQAYSWGDGLIGDCASGRIAPGDQTVWRGAGTSHHLRVVSEQVQATG